ncbi:MAG: hypothetical protein NTX15_01540 [Candidatus Kapabacteria bacterium]|nr:hypothetical protein [Candidatus Kapabacteria bacterium]
MLTYNAGRYVAEPFDANLYGGWYQVERDFDVDPALGNLVALPLDVASGGMHSLTEAMGIRFQPELDVIDTTVFTPRAGDDQGAIFGFQTRDLVHGSVPTNQADENYHRYVLSAATVTTPLPDPVLTDSWPQQKFAQWDEGAQFRQNSFFNGRRMYVGINLRRALATDVVVDDEPILRIRIRTQRMGANTIHQINFDSIPRAFDAANPLLFNNIALPNTLPPFGGAGLGRGLIHPMDENTTGVAVQEIVITRRMLPIGTDSELLHLMRVDHHKNSQTLSSVVALILARTT